MNVHSSTDKVEVERISWNGFFTLTWVSEITSTTSAVPALLGRVMMSRGRSSFVKHAARGELDVHE